MNIVPNQRLHVKRNIDLILFRELNISEIFAFAAIAVAVYNGFLFYRIAENNILIHDSQYFIAAVPSKINNSTGLQLNSVTP